VNGGKVRRTRRGRHYFLAQGNECDHKLATRYRIVRNDPTVLMIGFPGNCCSHPRTGIDPVDSDGVPRDPERRALAHGVRVFWIATAAVHGRWKKRTLIQHAILRGRRSNPRPRPAAASLTLPGALIQKRSVRLAFNDPRGDPWQ